MCPPRTRRRRRGAYTERQAPRPAGLGDAPRNRRQRQRVLEYRPVDRARHLDTAEITAEIARNASLMPARWICRMAEWRQTRSCSGCCSRSACTSSASAVTSFVRCGAVRSRLLPALAVSTLARALQILRPRLVLADKDLGTDGSNLETDPPPRNWIVCEVEPEFPLALLLPQVRHSRIERGVARIEHGDRSLTVAYEPPMSNVGRSARWRGANHRTKGGLPTLDRPSRRVRLERAREWTRSAGRPAHERPAGFATRPAASRG